MISENSSEMLTKIAFGCRDDEVEDSTLLASIGCDDCDAIKSVNEPQAAKRRMMGTMLHGSTTCSKPFLVVLALGLLANNVHAKPFYRLRNLDYRRLPCVICGICRVQFSV